MRSNSKLVLVRLNFRVNDLAFEDALMRPCDEDPTDFQLVIEHRFLGSFALHEDFVLEVRGADGSATWRKVKLEELKLAFLEASQNVGATETEDERAKSRGPDAAPVRLGTTTNNHLARIPVEGDAGHVERAKKVLSRGGVRYKIVGGVGSRGQIWGHATFLVDSLQGARALLCDGGFIPSSDSPHVLIDSKNGWKVHLLGESQG